VIKDLEFADILFDLRRDIRMLNQLSFTAGTSHPQSLQIPFMTITFMAFEMGDADEAVYHIDRMGNGNRFENEFANSDLIALFPPASHRR
jgi:hypothetical protein